MIKRIRRWLRERRLRRTHPASGHPDIRIGNYYGSSFYLPERNSIYLCAKDEESAMRTLTHELTHWAQYMFLEWEEMRHISVTYSIYLDAQLSYLSNERGVPPTHLIEKHACLISDGVRI
jgi:hypothetical protein